MLIRDDGNTYQFTRSAGGDWIPTYPGTPGRLTANEDGSGTVLEWIYKTSGGIEEHFHPDGRLTSITKQGIAHNLSYADSVVTVSHTDGSMLTLQYEENDPYAGLARLQSVTDADGNTYRYLREDELFGDNLTRVIYPDDTPADDSDNPQRTYLYENPDFPTFVTGIIDENGHYLSKVNYDLQGRATSSEGADGADRVTVSYETTRSIITNALDKQTIYNFEVINDVKQIISIEGLPTATCAGANKAFTYDANGFMTSKTDWNGNTTTYARDTRGLEISRTEASGTPDARTITTQWHTDYRLPVQITEPGKVTEFTYDANGRLLSRQERSVP